MVFHKNCGLYLPHSRIFLPKYLQAGLLEADALSPGWLVPSSRPELQLWPLPVLQARQVAQDTEHLWHREDCQSLIPHDHWHHQAHPVFTWNREQASTMVEPEQLANQPGGIPASLGQLGEGHRFRTRRATRSCGTQDSTMSIL